MDEEGEAKPSKKRKASGDKPKQPRGFQKPVPISPVRPDRPCTGLGAGDPAAAARGRQRVRGARQHHLTLSSCGCERQPAVLAWYLHGALCLGRLQRLFVRRSWRTGCSWRSQSQRGPRSPRWGQGRLLRGWRLQQLPGR